VASPSLQTIIVYKKHIPEKGVGKGKAVTRTRAQAKRIAEGFKFKSIYTSRETENSFRFRQRPPTDFVAGSFRTKRLPEFGVSLVYGKLKKDKSIKKIPGPYGHAGGGDDDSFSEDRKKNNKIFKKIEDLKADKSKSRNDKRYELAKICKEIEEFKTPYNVLRGSLILNAVDYGIILNMVKVPYDERKKKRLSLDAAMKIFKKICESPTQSQVELKLNSSKKKPLAKSISTKTRNLKEMPDPGPLALLGETLEFSWREGGAKKTKRRAGKSNPDLPGKQIWKPNGKWLFLWSPKHRAVVAIKKPTSAKKEPKVSRRGGAAKVSERFHARPAKKTWEMEIPRVPLELVGPAEHIVYRSDKWSATGETTDYIHEFNDGVKLYCGPSLKNPRVFLCMGGKLTVTERGLVF